jgi:protein TonB
MIGKLSTLSVALTFSVVVHAVLLTVRIVDPERFNRIFEDTPLEVILVNSRTSNPPDKPQAIAQVSLAGGGEAERGRATSPLLPSDQTEIGDADESSHRRIEELQQAQQRLLSQVRRDLAMLPAPDPTHDEGTPNVGAQEERQRQLVQLLAQIEKRVNEENARPKKRYISPATREKASAQYYDRLRRKIEDRGTSNFPERGGQKLYGELTMNVTIDASGRVIEVEVVQPSTSRELDRQAIAIVRAAAPFGPFTAGMRAEFDQMVVTSRFRFTREDGLETSMQGPTP